MSTFFRLLLRLLPVGLALLAASCGGGGADDGCIYRAGELEVFPDSIISRGHEYSLAVAVGHSELPRLTRGPRLACALFDKALQSPATPTALDVWLSHAWLYPGQSVSLLRSLGAAQSVTVPDITAPSGMPGPWGAAAWQTWLATGDEKWLAEASGMLKRRLEGCEIYASGSFPELLRGVPEHFQDNAVHYPAWMTVTQRWECLTLGVNTWFAESLRASSAMEGALGNEKAAKALHKRYTALRTVLNDHFWMPTTCLYGQYLYHPAFPMLSRVSDNYAGVLCVLTGVASPEMARRWLRAVPFAPEGIDISYPGISGARTFSPYISAMVGIAAVRQRNEAVLTAATATLWHSLLHQRNASAWPALLLRGFFGMEMTADGLSFKPLIPHWWGSETHLERFPYRGARLDIVISGVGDKIASFRLDGEMLSAPIVPPTLEGDHTVEIVLSGNALPAETFTSVESSGVLPPTPHYLVDDGKALLLNTPADMAVKWWFDGVASGIPSADEVTLPTPAPYGVAVAFETPEGFDGYTPAMIYPDGPGRLVTVRASEITPRRPPVHLIKDKAFAANYLEQTARHNTLLNTFVYVPAAGEYLLTFYSANGVAATASRRVIVNDRPAGLIFTPPGRTDDWITYSASTSLRLRLEEGVNKVGFLYQSGNLLFNHFTLRRIGK